MSHNNVFNHLHPFKFQEKDEDGSVIETIFDGSTIGQKIHPNVNKIRREIQAERTANRNTNGMSKGGNMRHIGRVPVELWIGWQRKYGMYFNKDKRLLKSLIREWQLNVVDPTRL